MSGHSKWASIKHKKAATDAKRGKAFTKVIKELQSRRVPEAEILKGTPSCARLFPTPRASTCPRDNIKRAIMKGTGELEGTSIEEIVYEGYGPGGVAVMVEVMTDNRNRTVGEIRHTFSKHGGNLGENGCVAWMFTKRGYILVPAGDVDEETAMNAAIEAGAEDFSAQEDQYEILTEPESF